MATAGIKGLLTNRNFIFFLSIVAGLLFSEAAEWMKPLILPVIALIMTLSTVGISNDIFRAPRTLLLPALTGTVNELPRPGRRHPGPGAKLFIEDEALRTGFVLIAAVPPAIAVIPFSHFLEGGHVLFPDRHRRGYLSALAFMPLMALGLLESMPVGAWQLVEIMLYLIVLAACRFPAHSLEGMAAADRTGAGRDRGLELFSGPLRHHRAEPTS